MTTLLVTATGGHLAELQQLVPRFNGAAAQRHWVTFDTPQSRDLLAGERVTYVPPVPPRNVARLLANVPLARRLLSDDVDCIVSNGSGIALAYLPVARALGIPAHYIECAARTRGPSLTGRLLEGVPGVRLYTQYPAWASGRWRFAGSVLDGFTARPATEPRPIRRVLVTVGTLLPYRRLVERMLAILPADVDVVWQTGATPVGDLPIDGHETLPPARLQEIAGEVDVVVAHAGIGSALLALRAGRTPVLVPREARAGEHVDDHQLQIAGELERRGLGLMRRVDDLTFADLTQTAATEVDAAARSAALVLG